MKDRGCLEIFETITFINTCIHDERKKGVVVIVSCDMGVYGNMYICI